MTQSIQDIAIAIGFIIRIQQRSVFDAIDEGRAKPPHWGPPCNLDNATFFARVLIHGKFAGSGVVQSGTGLIALPGRSWSHGVCRNVPLGTVSFPTWDFTDSLKLQLSQSFVVSSHARPDIVVVTSW